jgi:hypothetical protein
MPPSPRLSLAGGRLVIGIGRAMRRRIWIVSPGAASLEWRGRGVRAGVGGVGQAATAGIPIARFRPPAFAGSRLCRRKAAGPLFSAACGPCNVTGGERVRQFHISIYECQTATEKNTSRRCSARSKTKGRDKLAATICGDNLCGDNLFRKIWNRAMLCFGNPLRSGDRETQKTTNPNFLSRRSLISRVSAKNKFGKTCKAK